MIGFDDQASPDKVSPEKLADPAGEPSKLGPSSDPCPYCGADDCRDAKHWSEQADYWWRVAEEWRERCEAANKTSDKGAGDREGRILDGETGGRALAASPAVPPIGDATPNRQGGEGPVDEEGPGLSPELLPAGLIDRAVEIAARWEARIEKLATWEDRARAEQGKVSRWLEESGSKLAREVREDEYRHAYTGRVLRSLLTEGKEA